MDGLDKTYKPLVLTWLADLFGYQNYPHSFKDQWISWRIWDGLLTISFDSRLDEHNKLLSIIPCQFLGTPQHRTLKIVNEKTFYLTLSKLIDIKYPNIESSKLINKIKYRGGIGGWHSPSDDFYTYDWEVVLSDTTSIHYHNQVDKMDMVKGDFIYNAKIQEREFTKFLEKYKPA